MDGTSGERRLPRQAAARYDRPVTDRGPTDAPLACPFLAFEDDRDGRSARPDHRHRCYAEVRPAPRAIAHQERYCLTAAFASCPTFLDWVRREAAAVREPAGEGASLIGDWATPAASRGPVESGPSASAAEEEAGVEDHPRRDWAAPPSWSGRAGPERPGAPMPPFLAGREGGGAGAAEGTTGRRGSVEPDEAAAGWHGTERGGSVDDEAEGPVVTVIDPARRTRTVDPSGGVPPWERRRRPEAYPRLRTRMGLPALPPLLLAAAAVVVAALALFFLPPMLLNLGGEAPASPSPSPTLASPSIAASPMPTPAPTPLVYTVKAGDTLSKIAKQFGVSLDALIEANKATITNPDRINIGDQIVIPTPPPDVIPGGPSPEASGGAPSASP